MMSSVSTIEAHQANCRPHLLTLRMIAHDDTDPVLTCSGVVEVARAAQTVLAEAEAAARDAAGVGVVGPGATILIEVRLHRLAVAADAAIAAAGAADCQLRCHLHRFDALTAAIWTVLRAVHGADPRGHSAA